MSFQYIFNNAESISIDKGPVVAQTVARNNAVKSVSRGAATWKFTVKLPNGIRYEDLRGVIETIEQNDRHTSETIKLNNSGYTSWFTSYQGDSDVITGWDVTYTSGNTVTINTEPSGTNLTNGEYTFKRGDLIQLGSGHTYTVASDVVYPATTVTLHRPVLESAGTHALTIGPECQFNVICVQFPNWTIFQRNQVSWNRPFIFYEVI